MNAQPRDINESRSAKVLIEARKKCYSRIRVLGGWLTIVEVKLRGGRQNECAESKLAWKAK
jgi:hypothetical protein